MAIDKLQERVRKLKSPLAIDLFAQSEDIPPQLLLEGKSFLQAYLEYCSMLLPALKETVAAVRLDYGMFSICGVEGISILSAVASTAHKHGYYVLLQISEPLSWRNANFMAKTLFSSDHSIYFDGIVLTAYIGSDSISPFVPYLENSDKDLFVVARTSNRSAAEMQDLLSGSRLAYMAKADIVNRYAGGLVGKSGFSRIALIAAASSADCLRALRVKYKNLFLFLDGCDYPNANAKNCSAAFDKLGHGAVACAGLSVMAAWRNDEENDYTVAAGRAAERHRRNILRYVTVL